MIDPNPKAGTIRIPGPISCVSVKIPQIDWGPKLGGSLVDNGPFEITSLPIPGPIFVPGNATYPITFTGPLVSRSVKILEPIQTIPSYDGKHLSITLTVP